MYIVYHSLEYKVLILLGHQDLIERGYEVIGSKFCIKIFAWFYNQEFSSLTIEALVVVEEFRSRS